MILDAMAYAEQHRKDFIEQLYEWLRIPSVSTKPDHAHEVRRAADWIVADLARIGLENSRLIETEKHPLIYAEWLHHPSAPTVLFYGHYDVQPAEPLDEWHSAPFEPEERNGYIYARGVSDDKGQTWILIKAIESYLQGAGELPLNVKVILEGEEEDGGESLEAFIPQNQTLLSADIAYVADTHMIAIGQPSIVYGLRGMVAINLDLTTAQTDLHSGTYGGIIDNPLHILSHIVAQLKDENGHILIPHFYDDVRPLSAEERTLIAKNPKTEQSVLAHTGAPKVWGEPDYTMTERMGARPTLELNGIIGGYTGAGSKTVLPCHAHAKFTMRLVPNQEPSKVIEQFTSYVESIAPDTVQLKWDIRHSAPASISDYHHPAMSAAKKACLAVFGTEPIFILEGGSIPLAGLLQKWLGLETLLLGFGLPDDNLHAPNERFYKQNLIDGIATVIQFLDFYAGK